MAEQLKIQGKYLTAGETAKVLGVPKQRALRFVTMLKQPGSALTTGVGDSSIKLPAKSAAKKNSVSGTVLQRKRASNPVTKASVKRAGPATIGKYKKIGVAKPAYKTLRAVTGIPRKAAAKRYAPNKAVAKKKI